MTPAEDVRSGSSRLAELDFFHAGMKVIALALFPVWLAIYAPKWNTGTPSASTSVTLSAIGLGFTILAGFHLTRFSDHEWKIPPGAGY